MTAAFTPAQADAAAFLGLDRLPRPAAPLRSKNYLSGHAAGRLAAREGYVYRVDFDTRLVADRPTMAQYRQGWWDGAVEELTRRGVL